MTDGLNVAAHERNVVRVFALEMPRTTALALRDAPWRDPLLGKLLGLDRIDPAHVEIVDTADLSGVGLAGLLTEGHGADLAQVDADRARLSEVKGWVMIVGSGAFGGAAATLHPQPDVRLVGAYREDVPPVRFEPLPDAGAKGTLEPPAPQASPAPGTARSRHPALYVALAALLVLVVLAVFRAIAG